MADRFVSRYRGKRYSFGYPACPNLEDQAGIWLLLRPEDIGVHLTEGMMMDPEASVSALVFQHPDCTYFRWESRRPNHRHRSRCDFWCTCATAACDGNPRGIHAHQSFQCLSVQGGPCSFIIRVLLRKMANEDDPRAVPVNIRCDT